VKNLNAEEFSEEYPEAYRGITKKFYVDDFLQSEPTIEDAKKIVKDVTFVCKQ